MADSLKDFYRGDDLTYKIVLTDKAGNPVDITGDTFWITMKSDPSLDDNSAEIQESVSIHTDALNGETKISVPNTSTDSLTAGTTLYYDIQWVTSSNKVTTITKGKVKVLQDITRSI